MYFDLTDDERFLIVKSASRKEVNQLCLSMTKELPDAWILKKINENIETKKSFFSEFGLIPSGLYLELLKICKRYQLEYELSPKLVEFLKGDNISLDEFKSYVNELFLEAKNEKGEDFKPFDYQVEAAWKMIHFKKCCTEISTGGGKTLIAYIVFKYLFDVKGLKDFLYVVPSVDLATQSLEKFYEYESYLKKEKQDSWIGGILKSNLKKKEKEIAGTCNILFGTYHSLNKKNCDFFERFKCVIIDEAHHSKAKSFKRIIYLCTNMEYSYGMTGTFGDSESYEGFLIQSLLGPLVYKFTSWELINEVKKGTPVYVVFEILDYATKNEKILLYNIRSKKNKNDFRSGLEALDKEQEYINHNCIRMRYIADLVMKAKNNSLVLFGEVGPGYGKKIYEHIKERSSKNVYYCDGSTPSKNRDFYKEQMENDNTGNTILVASIGVMGEGIDVKNLWNIFLVNSAKSEKLVRQICGRGFRRYPGKDKVVLFDFVDDLRYSYKNMRYCHDNYMWNHYKERKRIYTSQGFPVFERNVKF